MGDNFLPQGACGGREWFGDDSSWLYLLCTLFLLPLHLLHLRPSGMTSWRLGTPCCIAQGPPKGEASRRRAKMGEGAVRWGGRRCAAQGSEGDARGAAARVLRPS